MTDDPIMTATRLSDAGIPFYVVQPDGAGGFDLNRRHPTKADPRQVHEWQPGAGLCMVTGHGIDVVDIDPRNGGSIASWWQWVDERAGRKQRPEVVAMVATPSGGAHLYIRSTGATLAAPIDGLPGVDYRGRGGMVFVPPTVKLSKETGDPTPYVWAWEVRPDWQAVAPSTWIADHIGRKRDPLPDGDDWYSTYRRQSEPAVSDDLASQMYADALSDVRQQRPDGGGFRHALNRAAFTIGRLVGAGWVDEDTAHRDLRDAVRAVWGAPDHDDLRWIDDGLRDGQEQPVQLEATPEQAKEFAREAGSHETTAGNDSGTDTGDGWLPDKLPAKLGGFQPANSAHNVMRAGPLRVGTDQTLWSCENGVWRQDNHVVRRRLALRMGNDFRSGHLSDVEKMTRGLLDADGKTITADPVPRWINFRNGLLDWEQGTRQPWDPEILSTAQMGVDYVEGDDTPVFDRFLSEVVAPDVVPVIWDLIAYLMYSGNPWHTAVMLVGDGRNGKGVLLRLLTRILGRANVASVTLHELIDSRFTPALLHGKIANLAGEIDAADLKRTDQLKSLTGGDTIKAERKNQQPFEFVNWAVPVFAVNEIPRSSDGTNGFFSRWLVIEFPNSFLGREDRHLDDKLAREAAVIASKAARRLPDVMAAGRWVNTPSLQRAREEFRRQSDQVQQWIDDAMVRDRDAWTSRSTLYGMYGAWTDGEGNGKISAQKFCGRLRGLGFGEAKRQGVRGFYGLRARRPGDPYDDDGDGADPEPYPDGRELVEPQNGSTGHPESDPTAESAPDKTPSQPSKRHKGHLSGTSSNSEEKSPYSETISIWGSELEKSAPPAGPSQAVVLDLETRSATELHAPATSGPFVRLGGVLRTDIREKSRPVELTTDGDAVAQSAQSSRLVIGHNLMRFDLPALQRHHGLDLFDLVDRGAVADTLLLARQADPAPARTRRYHELDKVADRLGVGRKTDGLAKLKRKHGGYDKIPTDDPEYRDYLRNDVKVTRDVYRALATWTDDPYVQREHRIAAITATITANGFRVDPELLAARRSEGAQRVQEALCELGSSFGVPMDGKAPLASQNGKDAILAALQQLGVADDDIPRTAKTGALSTNGDALAELAVEYPQASRLVELVTTVVSNRTVYDTIAHHVIDADDGTQRVYPSISSEQSTGRWSVTEPGLTVIGKRGQRWRERQVFLPEPGHQLVSIDLAQIDARAVAALSGDAAYQAMFAPGVDLHAEIATRVWGDRARREDAKAIGHGWNYGMGVAGLARTTGTGELAARQFDEAMRQQFPILVAWKQQVAREAQMTGMLVNGFGRRLRPDPERAYTQGPAFMGQSTARDLLAEGLLRLDRSIYPFLRTIVHDEIVLSIPDSIVHDVTAYVVGALSFEWGGVQVIADADQDDHGRYIGGSNWAAAYGKG